MEEIKIISHRGLSSIFPQNTIQAITAGIYSADYVQFDIMLSADNEVVVFHDRGLMRLTNISSLSQFRERIRKAEIQKQGKSQFNWWVRDFTYPQLQKLKVRQPFQNRPQFRDQQFKISRLQSIIQESVKVAKVGKIKSGLLIQFKQQIKNKVTQRDLRLCDLVLGILQRYNLNTKQGCKDNNLDVVLQSFNIKLLEYMYNKCENSFVQLYSKSVKINQLVIRDNYHPKVKGIGITEEHILYNLNRDKDKDKSLSEICKKHNYKIFYWTIRDDFKQKPFNCSNYYQVYALLKCQGVSHFITEFPDKCKAIFKLQSSQFQIKKQENNQIQSKELSPTNQHNNTSIKNSLCQPFS